NSSARARRWRPARPRPGLVSPCSPPSTPLVAKARSMHVTYRTFELPLRHVFTIARGSTEVQETFIVELSHEGKYGYGEATTNDYYGATAQAMAQTVESVRPLIEASDARD